MVFAAYPVSGYAGENFYVGEFLEELFNGLASTFVDEVREKRGLAYTVGATRLSGKEKGMFCLFAGTHAEATEAVETEMSRAVQRILDRKLTKEEFETARTSLKVNRQRMLQSAGNRYSGQREKHREKSVCRGVQCPFGTSERTMVALRGSDQRDDA